MILGSAVLLLVQNASGDEIFSFGGLVIPFDDEWWRFLTAPFAYVNVGYLFVVALGAGDLRDRGRAPARQRPDRGAAGRLRCPRDARRAAASPTLRTASTVIAGGNGMALGALAAWFAIRRAEARGAIAEEYDVIGVVVCAAVLIALPLFVETADLVAGLVGGVVGALAGPASPRPAPGRVN